MIRFIAFLFALLACCGAQAQGVLPVPELSARVIDQTGTLDAIQSKGLEDKLAAFEREKGTQIVVLMVPTTSPEDIASYANRVANAWKIGRRDVGDGIVVIVAKNDRKVRIEVAKTLEGAVPDLAAKMIIDAAITPRFRQGDFAGGLQTAVDQLIARITAERLPQPDAGKAQRLGNAGFDWFDLAILLFVAVPVAGGVLRGIFGRKLGSMLTSGGIGAVALLLTSSLIVASIAAFIALMISLLSGGVPRGRRGSWDAGTFAGGWGGGGGGGWGGGGGGGFSSGGGGDFGGGGASGDW